MRTGLEGADQEVPVLPAVCTDTLEAVVRTEAEADNLPVEADIRTCWAVHLGLEDTLD